MLSCEFCQIFQNTLQNTSGWLLLLNTLYSLRRPQSQVTFDLGYFKMINSKHVHSKRWIAARKCFWNLYIISCDWFDLLLIKQAMRSKCCCKSEAVTQQSLEKVEIMFCKLHKFHKKVLLIESLFHKTVSYYACNCTHHHWCFSFQLSFQSFHFSINFFSRRFCLKKVSI